MKAFKIILSLCLLALLVGCGGKSGKSPLVGKKTEAVVAWRLDKLDEKKFSKSWDDFSELLLTRGLVPDDFEDLFDDLAKQKVSIVYLIHDKKTAVYLAFDVSSCNKKQLDEVEDILKDFCKEDKSDRKFYDTDQGFYYIGQDNSDFRKLVRNAKLQSWKKEDRWPLIQSYFNETQFDFYAGERNEEYMSISDLFPSCFLPPYAMRKNEKLEKYTTGFKSDTAVKFKAKFIQGESTCVNPQKCVFTYQVTLDSKENAQKVQKYFNEYMTDLGKVLDDKKISKFLTSQKCKVSGSSVIWEFDEAWLKANKGVMEDFKSALKEYKEDATAADASAEEGF